jgi:prepilin-type N-terminal cleavage/methylation domain-containing protein
MKQILSDAEKSLDRHNRSAFTLIELLIVMGVIAVLAIVVILVLNPLQIFLQSKDAGRLYDLGTFGSVINRYLQDVTIPNLGMASTTYISIPDSTATSSAGDQCQGLGLPSLPTGWTYHCASPSTYRAINGTGWMPVDLTKLSTGAPISALPVDPANIAASGLYYTYTTDGKTGYEVTTLVASAKYRASTEAQSPATAGLALSLYPGVLAIGNNMTLSALWSPLGIVSYWPLDESMGASSASDIIGSNSGSCDTACPISGIAGKLSNAAAFDGVNRYAFIGNPSNLNFGTSPFSVSLWVYVTSTAGLYDIPWAKGGFDASIPGYDMELGSGPWDAYYEDNSNNYVFLHFTASAPIFNQWTLLTLVFDTATGNAYAYANGTRTDTQSIVGFSSVSTAYNAVIGANCDQAHVCANEFKGLIDDVRVYSRALSAAEVMALYNSEQ